MKWHCKLVHGCMVYTKNARLQLQVHHFSGYSKHGIKGTSCSWKAIIVFFADLHAKTYKMRITYSWGNFCTCRHSIWLWKLVHASKLFQVWNLICLHGLSLKHIVTSGWQMVFKRICSQKKQGQTLICQIRSQIHSSLLYIYIYIIETSSGYKLCSSGSTQNLHQLLYSISRVTDFILWAHVGHWISHGR